MGIIKYRNDSKIISLTLIELVHSQPPTLMNTDNYTASGIVNNTSKQERLQAIEI